MVADISLSTGKLSPDDIIREVKHLPSAPKILPLLKALLMNPNSSMSEIVSLVRLDAGIAARVLQTGNSAHFSMGARCATVDEAVNRVGYDQIYDLVSFAVASQVLVRPLAIYGIEADELWKMSVSCALAAEALAGRTSLDRDAAYTVGLLHCVGMVALDEWSMRGAHKLVFKWAGLPREAVESERAALGFTQAETGAALLTHWEFPLTTSEPVRWQYTPGASADHAAMASLLLAAKWVRSAVCAPTNAACPALPEAIQLQPLGLNPSMLIGVADEVTRRLASITSMLESVTKPAERHPVPPQGPVGKPVDRHLFPSQSWRE